MNREQTARALNEIAASPAASWIGNKVLGADPGAPMRLMQRCMRCGTEQTLALPYGMSATPSPVDVPVGFDERLFAWKRDFQRAHEGCVAVVGGGVE